MKKYPDIKSELDSLTRQEQYRALLLTKEWHDFRLKILKLDSHQCQVCQLKEGPIEEKVPTEVYQKEMEVVLKHNEEFRKKSKDRDFQERQLKILMGEINGEFEGLMPFPSDTNIVGHAILQIHHILYYLTHLPWEYQRKDVVTLCASCHKAEHENKEIYLYDDQTKSKKTKLVCCSKCGGTGFLPEYDYFKNGICFSCGGQGML
jgi:5-methylcytosine-specific restriction endonuclease McrA